MDTEQQPSQRDQIEALLAHADVRQALSDVEDTWSNVGQLVGVVRLMNQRLHTLDEQIRAQSDQIDELTRALRFALDLLPQDLRPRRPARHRSAA